MSEKPLKALLIVGADFSPISNEIKELYNRSDCLIIGDGVKNVSIADIQTELEAKNFVLDNTRVDIRAHGMQDENDKKQHFIWLKYEEPIKTKDFFANLRKISNKPLNVQLWSCYGSTANKDAVFLGSGSSLTTHVESENTSRIKLAEFSLQKSLKRYFDGKELTQEEQFIVDFPENFETMTFSKVGNDTNVTKYKTTRFLKDDKTADLVEVLKDSSDLKSIVHNDIKLNKQLFCVNLPKDVAAKIEKTEISLSNEQVQDYIAGRLMHAIEKEIIKEDIELLELLKNKGLDLHHEVNGISLLSDSTQNSKILKQFIKNIPDINIADNYGLTLLHTAAGMKDAESVKELLLHSNIDVSKKDFDGDTPLDLAIEGNEKDIVKIFLENKKFSILDLKPENRKKALEVAMEYGFNVKPPITSKPVLTPKPPEPKPRTIIPPKAKPRTTAAVKPPIAPKPVIQDTPPPVTKTRIDASPKPRTTIPTAAPNMITKPPIAPKPIVTPKNVVTEAEPEPKPRTTITPPVAKPRLTPSAPKPKPRSPHGRG